MTLAAVTPDLASPTRHEAPSPETRRADDAAKRFETIVVQQLLSILRKTAPDAGLVGGGGMGNSTYVQMFDDAIAERLVEGGGIGLAPMLSRSMGGQDASQNAATLSTTHRAAFQAAFVPQASEPTHGALLPGLGRRLQQTAAALMSGDSGSRWSRGGELRPTELGSDLVTNEADGPARFNVRDANGYQGAYKCNLFALEVARRAGFQVPVVSRPRGWGYPGATRLTVDAEDRSLEGGWGRVVTGENAASLDSGVRDGSRAFMLVGRGTEGHAGHMAVVERVHDISYDADGEVERVVFSGWEARSQGAQHIPRRTWNRYGNPGGEQARNGFTGIQVIELSPRRPDAREEIPLSSSTGASLFDELPSRSGPDRPTPSSEE